MPWSAEEDALLHHLVQTLGHQWKKIAELLPGRSSSSTRNRWTRIGKAAFKTADSARPSSQGYLCRRCGLPKKGHKCGVPAEEQPVAPSGPTSPLSDLPRRRSVSDAAVSIASRRQVMQQAPMAMGQPLHPFRCPAASTPELPGGLVHGGLREAAAGSLSSLPAEIEESMLPMLNSQRQTGTGTGRQHPVGVQTSFDSSHFLAPARPAVVAIPVQQGVWASTSGGTGLAGVAPTPACFAAPAASTAVGAPAHAPRAPAWGRLSLGMLAAESEATACEPWPRGEGETVGAGEASAPEAMEEGVEVAGDKAEEAAPRDEVMAEAGEEDEATEDEASPVAPRRVPCKAAGAVVGEWWPADGDGAASGGEAVKPGTAATPWSTEAVAE